MCFCGTVLGWQGSEKWRLTIVQKETFVFSCSKRLDGRGHMAGFLCLLSPSPSKYFKQVLSGLGVREPVREVTVLSILSCYQDEFLWAAGWGWVTFVLVLKVKASEVWHLSYLSSWTWRLRIAAICHG